MSVKSYVKSTLIAALVVLAVGGFLLHTRVHPVSRSWSNLVPLVAGVLSIAAVPLLFSFRKTVSYGYTLNGMLAIIGTVVMAHFSIVHLPKPITIPAIVFQTTLADIALLWGKFLVGKALFDLETFGYDPAREKKGKFLRYPNYGWWLVHLAAIALVYFLGKLIWR